jgi:oligopeptide/dipeptide ABC transporter ATP-binding protein
MALLEVRDLRTWFRLPDGVAKAVDGVSFDLEKGKTTALVGESGCGKTVASYSIMGLVPEPNGFIASGTIMYNGEDLAKLPFSRMRALRGSKISMIFQEPSLALNPVFTVGAQLAEAVAAHQRTDPRSARERCVAMLKEVGIPAPELRFNEYPHQLSGGMKQRIMIAMALLSEPDILIADEPTTALDVTIQAQILDLLSRVRGKFGTAILLITHDLAIVSEYADTVTVMYAGKVAEQGGVRTVLDRPSHPYTQGLLKSLPSMHRPGERLYSISGVVPDAGDFPEGCRFRTRCPEAREDCGREPALKRIATGALCACHFRT